MCGCGCFGGSLGIFCGHFYKGRICLFDVFTPFFFLVLSVGCFFFFSLFILFILYVSNFTTKKDKNSV